MAYGALRASREAICAKAFWKTLAEIFRKMRKQMDEETPISGVSACGAASGIGAMAKRVCVAGATGEVQLEL